MITSNHKIDACLHRILINKHSVEALISKILFVIS